MDPRPCSAPVRQGEEQSQRGLRYLSWVDRDQYGTSYGDKSAIEDLRERTEIIIRQGDEG